MTPTARCLKECRRRGWTAQVVEQTIPRTFIKRDLFGVIDIVAIMPGGDGLGWPRLIGIQVTSGSNHAARRTKAEAEPRLRLWLSTGAQFEIWSYAKQGARRKRKMWVLRTEEIVL